MPPSLMLRLLLYQLLLRLPLPHLPLRHQRRLHQQQQHLSPLLLSPQLMSLTSLGLEMEVAEALYGARCASWILPCCAKREACTRCSLFDEKRVLAREDVFISHLRGLEASIRAIQYDAFFNSWHYTFRQH
jgi:hypothetical protein